VRALLLYNPRATRSRKASRHAVIRMLADHVKLDVEMTKRRDHATYLAAGAAHEGYEVVLTLGGDGTMNEALQGVVGTDVKLATIPAGSTNVWARTLGLPNDPVQATAVILEALHQGRERRVPLGVANGRYFTFNIGLGLDAAVVRQVERRHRFKRAAGQLSFLYWGLVTLLASYDRRTDITVVVDGSDAVTGNRTVVCCNSNPFAYLGPRPVVICPGAALGEALAISGLGRLGLGSLLRLVAASTRERGPGHIPWLRQWTAVEGAELRASRPLPLQVDGDYLGEVDRVVVTYAPDGATFVA
jgi:diacylglycerol kinase family enzyme